MNEKKVYIIIIILTLTLIIYDHLQVPFYQYLPAQTEEACAPCGAPYEQ